MTALNRRIKRETMVFYTLFMVVCTTIGWLFFRVCMPQWEFSTYWLIALFYYAFGVATGFAYSFTEVTLPGRTLHFYMVQKVVKIFLSMAILLLVAYFGGESRRVFMLTFLAFYFLTMGFEVWFFSRIEFIKKMIERDNKNYRRRRRRIVKK